MQRGIFELKQKAESFFSHFFPRVAFKWQLHCFTDTDRDSAVYGLLN